MTVPGTNPPFGPTAANDRCCQEADPYLNHRLAAEGGRPAALFDQEMLDVIYAPCRFTGIGQGSFEAFAVPWRSARGAATDLQTLQIHFYVAIPDQVRRQVKARLDRFPTGQVDKH